MRTLRDELRALVGPERDKPAPPLEPPNVNGQESALVWSDNLGASGDGGGTAAPSSLLELTEIPGTQLFYPAVLLYDSYGVHSVEVRPIRQMQALDQDGNVVTVHFNNPYQAGGA